MTIAPNSPITAPTETNILQSFSDATAGRSVQLFWGMATTDSVGTSYILSRDAGNSDPISTRKAHPLLIDVNFEITINKPTLVNGICSIDVTMGNAHAGPTAQTISLTLNLYHVRGAVDTLIGTKTTKSVTTSSTNVVSPTKVLMELAKITFGIGDKLKLEIKGTNNVYSQDLYHDPHTAGNELKLWLPIVNME